jgi:hypothetical protein
MDYHTRWKKDLGGKIILFPERKVLFVYKLVENSCINSKFCDWAI